MLLSRSVSKADPMFVPEFFRSQKNPEGKEAQGQYKAGMDKRPQIRTSILTVKHVSQERERMQTETLQKSCDVSLAQ